MKIKIHVNEFKSETVAQAIQEIYNDKEGLYWDVDKYRQTVGLSLADAAEEVASHIIYTDTDFEYEEVK
jgi:uncharacterized protein (UPF0335 family)